MNPEIVPALIPFSIPSPSEGVWHLGPFPIRAYALAIILGVIAAVWVGDKRWIARGGKPGQIADIALWAVPAGLIGARLYHVATDSDLYFGSGPGRPIEALAVWHGGLGIWGAIAGGLFGAWLYTRRHGIRLRVLADAMAPGLLLAQAIGRVGNYFNQELYGRPTDLPWGLEIDPSNYPDGPTQFPVGTLFHPTFLSEALWNLAGIALLLHLDRRYRLGYGRVFAIYVMIYTAGRGWIEALRIDTIELNDVLGLRWGVWMSIILFVGAAVYFVVVGRRHPAPDSREPSPYVDGADPADGPAAEPEAEAGAAAPAETDNVKDSSQTPPD
ncbi:MAG: prolipoprotein diacylglyceryl transferase [Marmoricola sp.]